MSDRELSNSDRVPHSNNLPREVHRLAQHVASDLVELTAITEAAPPGIRPHLAHIALTMTRSAVFLEAIIQEGTDCARRIAERGLQMEAALEQRAEEAEQQMRRAGAGSAQRPARSMGDLMREMFEALEQRERRPVGFRDGRDSGGHDEPPAKH